ncbi:MAG: alpha/beta hydrolase [Alkalispirochaeta sp.]
MSVTRLGYLYDMHEIPYDSIVAAGALPFERVGDARKPVILLFHGFTGYPGDMRYLADRLNAVGYTVVVPRLPGHGTNHEDFQSTSARDWWRRAVDSYLDVAARHEHVVVGGLSMGGLLATMVASSFPIDGLLLFAPAFRVTNRLVALTPLLRYLVPPLRVKHPESYDDAERQYLADEYWNWQWPAQTASLYALMRRGRKELSGVDVPTLTVVSEGDETVPVAVADEIDARLAGDSHYVLRLSESDHVVTNGCDREAVADAVVQWLAEEDGQE